MVKYHRWSMSDESVSDLMERIDRYYSSCKVISVFYAHGRYFAILEKIIKEGDYNVGEI